MFDVISIGAATVDIFAKSNQFLVKDNLLSIPYSSKEEINQSLICSGGGATNTAVSFSRLNLKATCLSIIGNDNLKGFILDDLKADNISTNCLISSSKDTTDFSVILVAPDGGRSILTNRGQSRLEEKNINWDKLQTKWLYITSLEGNLDLLEKLIGYALENNIKIALNPGNRELTQKKLLIPFIKHVDFLLLNQTESEMLTENCKNLGAKITAVTDGRNGAHVFTDGRQYYSPIINVDSIDETGAGDAFGSAFIAALIHKLDPKQALDWGIKNSASVVSFLGAKPGLLTLETIRN